MVHGLRTLLFGVTFLASSERISSPTLWHSLFACGMAIILVKGTNDEILLVKWNSSLDDEFNVVQDRTCMFSNSLYEEIVSSEWMENGNLERNGL